MDEQVPSAITFALRLRGVDVLTVQDEGREGTPDAGVLDRAALLGRVVFTRDADFLREAVRRLRGGEFFAGVIFAHQLLVPTGRCIAELELICLASFPGEYDNHIEYLSGRGTAP